MAFDPIQYGQMLDAALNTGRRPLYDGDLSGSAPQLPAQNQPTARYGQPPSIDGGTPAGASGQPPSADVPDSGLDQQARQQPTIDGMPTPGAGSTKTTGPGKKPIEAMPPFKLQYDQDKLKSITKPADVVDAMTPKSQTKYMDWWESKYGSIQDKWNAVQQELGKRPDPDRQMSRKEQFQMLMDFGVRLMHASSHGDPGPGSTALAGALGAQQGRRQAEVGEYDQRAAGVNKGRADELKGIGDYGAALKSQSQIDNQGVQAEEARARMTKAGNAAPDTVATDQGLYAYDAPSKGFKPVLGIDGKPLTNLKVGGHGGAQRDSRTANEKNIEDLKDRGVPEDLAVKLVYHRISDPRKAYESLYRDRRRSYASDTEAAQESERVISMLYGDDWQNQGSGNLIPPTAANTPPTSLWKGKEDQIIKFKSGERWRLGTDGQPQQVK